MHAFLTRLLELLENIFTFSGSVPGAFCDVCSTEQVCSALLNINAGSSAPDVSTLARCTIEEREIITLFIDNTETQGNIEFINIT